MRWMRMRAYDVGEGTHAVERRQVEDAELERCVGHRLADSGHDASPLSSLRTASTTWAPAAASARAVSSPRPVDAPVTTATLPLRSTPSSTSSVVVCSP